MNTILFFKRLKTYVRQNFQTAKAAMNKHYMKYDSMSV